MRTRNFIPVSGGAGIAAVLLGTVLATALSTAPSAAADTVDDLPPVSPAFSRAEVHGGVISPYGTTATCDSFHAAIVDCWQQRPDGRWQEMTLVGDSYPGGDDPLIVYPVWEDAGSLTALSS